MNNRGSFVAVAFVVLFGCGQLLWSGGRGESNSADGAGPMGQAPSNSSITSRNGSAQVAYDPQAVRAELAAMGIRVVDGAIRAADFDLPTPNGGSVSLESLRGQFVFLNFWATWCPPCREEMPSMERLHESMADRPITILAVSVQETAAIVQRFLTEFPYSFPIAIDGNGRTAASYGVRGIPTSFFIGPEGTVLGVLVGIRHWDDEATIAAFERIATMVEGLR